jgi:histidinol-phosphatase
MTSSIPKDFVVAESGRAVVSTDELAAALAVAHQACDLARNEILPRFRNVAVETKDDGSPVTEADREAERVIRETILASFPDDAILGEEFGAAGGANARRQWIIDPIDGTVAFARGIPLFTTLIALLVDGEPVLGIIDLPAINDRIGGIRGGGVYRSQAGRPDERVNVSAGPALVDSLVCHGDLFCFELAGLRPAYDALSQAIPKLRGYTDAFGHLLVLSGAADAMMDCDLNPWDAAVTRVLAAEAGGLCWVREREGGAKIDLLFGSPATVEAIGKLID